MAPQGQWPKSATALIQELESGSDRAAIILGGSLLELAIEDCLLAILRKPQSNEETTRLFGRGGMVETFNQKISACYFLNIVSIKTRRDLDTIRKIRNISAHRLDPVTFEDQRIADLCGNLRVANATLPLIPNRKKFTLAVQILAGAFIAHAVSFANKPGLAGGLDHLKGFRLAGDDDESP